MWCSRFTTSVPMAHCALQLITWIQYSESSVIRTLIIQTLDYLDHKNTWFLPMFGTKHCLFCSDYEMTLGKCQKGVLLRNYTVQEWAKLQYWLSSGTDHDAMFIVPYNSPYFHLSEWNLCGIWPMGFGNRGFTVLEQWGLTCYIPSEVMWDPAIPRL